MSSPVRRFVNAGYSGPQPPDRSTGAGPMVSGCLNSRTQHIRSSRFMPPPMILCSGYVARVLSVLPSIQF